RWYRDCRAAYSASIALAPRLKAHGCTARSWTVAAGIPIPGKGASISFRDDTRGCPSSLAAAETLASIKPHRPANATAAQNAPGLPGHCKADLEEEPCQTEAAPPAHHRPLPSPRPSPSATAREADSRNPGVEQLRLDRPRTGSICSDAQDRPY